LSNIVLMSTGRGSRLRTMLPPLENCDPGDETAEDESQA
jgi:hypothetical protein